MIYIGTDSGIFRWFSGSPWPIFHSLQDRPIVNLATAGDGVLAALDRAGRVWESLNSGLDWRIVPRPEGLGRPTALALAAADTPQLVLATAGPLQIFTRPVGLVLEDESRESSALAVARRLVSGVFGTTSSARGGTAIATRRVADPNRGWKPLGVPEVSLAASLNGVRQLVIPDRSRPWFTAVVAGGLWRSDNAGHSWSLCPGIPNEVYAVRVSGETIALGTCDGAWMSNDAGRSWSNRSTGLDSNHRVSAIEIKPGHENVLLAGASVTGAVNGAPSGALFESKDGGQSWKHVTRGFPPDLESVPIVDIRYDPADTDFAVVALAAGEMWRTATDGLWWEPLARQYGRARVLCPFAPKPQESAP